VQANNDILPVRLAARTWCSGEGGVVTVKPNRSEEGEIDHFILRKMVGRNTIDQIAELVQEHFPVRFKTQEIAQFYVKAQAQQYGQLHALNPEVIN
jgi:hypothetical protein